jgi:uncharacterized protein YcaQ
VATVHELSRADARATADRVAGVLRVDAIHQGVTFDQAMTAAVDHEIKDLAHWLELDLMLPA